MGCSPSKLSGGEDSNTVPNRLIISAPQGGPVIIPPTRRDDQGIPIPSRPLDLNREDLRRALSRVATFLTGQRTDLVLITMGGAVNTILLRTRDTTHDVDFISPIVTADQMHLLSQASSAAMEQAETSLGEQWINNQTSLFVPAQLQNELAQDARVQNEIVFQEPGLTVLAVPWKYALCAKLERMGKSTRRSYDVDDAVAYLDRHIHVHGGNVVSFKDLENWGINYHTAVTRPLAQEVAERYCQIHGSGGYCLRLRRGYIMLLPHNCDKASNSAKKGLCMR